MKFHNIESSLEGNVVKIIAEYDGSEFLIVVEYSEYQLAKLFYKEFMQYVWSGGDWMQPPEPEPTNETVHLKEWYSENMTTERAETLLMAAKVSANNLQIVSA